jgi:hypothetical protein
MSNQRGKGDTSQMKGTAMSKNTDDGLGVFRALKNVLVLSALAALVFAVAMAVCGCTTLDKLTGNDKPAQPQEEETPGTPDIVKPIETPQLAASAFVQADGQRLTLDGKEWRFKADTAWMLGENLAGNRAAVCQYLDARKAQGFNVAMIGCNGKWFAGDASKPNATLFARLDATFADAEARGMFIILCPQITAYDANGKPYAAIPKAQSETVGAYYAMRYGNQRALAFWMVGGADDPSSGIGAADLVAFARGIRSQDANHLITYHPKAGRTSLYVAPVGDLHGLCLYQSYHTYDQATHRANLQAMQATGRPFANIEGPFESEPGVPLQSVVDAAAWASAFPVCGWGYGHTDVWPFGNRWKAAMNSGGVGKWMRATK